MSLTTRRVLWLTPLAVVAYLLRFGASWFVLTRVGTDAFDPHAFGLLGDYVILLALALPLLALLAWILWRRRPWRGLFAAASTPGGTASSVLLLLLIGAPTPQQFRAFALPLQDHWPVLLAVLLWFALCAVLRALAVARPEARDRAGSSVAGAPVSRGTKSCGRVGPGRSGEARASDPATEVRITLQSWAALSGTGQGLPSPG